MSEIMSLKKSTIVQHSSSTECHESNPEHLSFPFGNYFINIILQLYFINIILQLYFINIILQLYFINIIVDEPTWRCHQNPFIGALGIQEPVIPGEPLIKG